MEEMIMIFLMALLWCAYDGYCLRGTNAGGVTL